MPYQNESDLKYIDSLEDIPVTNQGIGDSWGEEDKLQAAEAGEEKLEGDVNEGHAISQSKSIHGTAAATWATYKLAVGMKSPDSTTRGDSLDEGTERFGFADRLKQMYQSYVNTINDASGFESDDDSNNDVTFSVADW
jgi:hypothetical protein